MLDTELIYKILLPNNMYLICLFLENKHMHLKTFALGKSCYLMQNFSPTRFFELKENKKHALINIKQ